jgi:hypothetical protein
MELVIARSGDPTLKIGDRLLHSAYDPVREARREVEAIAADRPSSVVILGTGLGYTVDAALELLPDARILAVEADAELHEFARAARPMPENPRVTWVVGKNEVANFAAISFCIDAVAATGIRYLSRLADLDPPHYHAIVRIVGRAAAMQLEGLRSTAEFGALWWENSVRNWREWAMLPDVGGWYGAYRNQPVFVLAAGPTLSEHLELLSSGDGGIRFVVDTAYPIAVAAGVRVDAVFAIDAQPLTLSHFEPARPARVCGVPVIPPPLWKMAPESILMSLDGPHFQWFDDALGVPVARLKSGGSVTTFAFDLARRMAASPIILVGADFAHRRGRRHAAGTSYERRDAASLTRFLGREQISRRNRVAIDGHDTEDVLAQYAQWMRWEIRETRAAVFRASNFGLLDGVPVIERERMRGIVNGPPPRLEAPPHRNIDPRRLLEGFRVERTTLELALQKDPDALRALSGFFDPITRPAAVASVRDGLDDETLEHLVTKFRRAAEVLDEILSSS